MARNSLFEGGIEATRPCIRGTKHMLAAGHFAAAHAGYAMLEAGGNAADAGVTAGIALGVVQSDIVNFAGVAPIMYFDAATRKMQAISGLGTWPRAASVELFEKLHGGAIPEGILRSIVPSAPDAWITCLERFGTRSFGECAAAAIRLARDGFPINAFFVDQITTYADKYARWPANREVYLPNGAPPRVGEIFRQVDLAKTLQYMADEEAAAASLGRTQALARARNAFYAGDIMRAIVSFHRQNGGLLREDDFAAFSVEVESSVERGFGGATFYVCPPWCQGPVLLQTLAMLEDDCIAEYGHNSADYIGLLVQALDLAFADRDRYYVDPRFAEVPVDKLLSREHAGSLRRKINPRTPGVSSALHEQRVAMESGCRDTSYVAVIDRFGNAMSATPSDSSYDSMLVGGTGLVPSSRGAQSWGVASHPSSVAPGKRPRLTPMPAMIRWADGGIMPFGSPGGDVQAQAMLQFTLNVMCFEMSVQKAIDAPRFATYNFPSSFEPHDDAGPGVCIEGRVSPDVRQALRKRGFEVTDWPDFTWRAGAVCAVRSTPHAGVLEAGADPRRPSYALGC